MSKTHLSTSNKQKILVLSPHLDDAVLSCCDHILEWKKQGHEITIITVFTKFSDEAISEAGKENLHKSSFTDVKKYEKQRKKEDKEAMQALGVKWKHLDFVDGGFRSNTGKPLYSRNELFSGKIFSADKKCVFEIGKSLIEYRKYESIIIPFGIGKHIDHIIVKQIATEFFFDRQLLYYVDFPYALILHNWSFPQWLHLITKLYSVNKISKQKQKILELYKTQLSLLFQNKPAFRELIVNI